MAEQSANELLVYDGEYDFRLQIDGRYFDMSQIRSTRVSNQLCDVKFEIGQTACGQIDIEMEKPSSDFSRMAKIIPYTRRIDSQTVGDWKRRGIYYIDTREEEVDSGGNSLLHLTGYDGMLKTSKDYGNLGLTYPATTLAAVRKLASLSGLELDTETANLLNDGQTIPEPKYYTGREILGFIAAMYGGSFMMTSEGKLKLVNMADMLVADEELEDKVLADQSNVPIEIGGVYILA